MNKDIWMIIEGCTKRLDPDPEHAFQVCKLSLMLFDCLSDLHQQDTNARDLLRAGSLLHDVGWSFPGKPHHKASCDWIISENVIPFTKMERIMVALIARYHRRSYPDIKHVLYRDLDTKDQNIVRYCSSMLRIADMLDRTHNSQVKTLHCEITPDTILISCDSVTSFTPEESFFSEKAGLLELLTNRRICLICN